MLGYFDADASSVTIQFCKSAICADWNVRERESSSAAFDKQMHFIMLISVVGCLYLNLNRVTSVFSFSTSATVYIIQLTVISVTLVFCLSVTTII
jgi:hypothetical protein